MNPERLKQLQANKASVRIGGKVLALRLYIRTIVHFNNIIIMAIKSLFNSIYLFYSILIVNSLIQWSAY